MMPAFRWGWAFAPVALLALLAFSGHQWSKRQYKVATPPVRIAGVEQAAVDDLSEPLPLDREQMGYELLLLLSEAHVQAELRLTADERREIARLADECLQKAGPIYLAGRNHAGKSPDIAARQEAEADEVRRQIMVEYGGLAAHSLSTAQRERFDQVLFQLRSLEVYSLPEFIRALALTPEQQSRIAQIRREVVGVMSALRRSWRDKRIDRSEYEEKVHQGLVASEEAIDAVLTSEQRDKVATWRGPRLAFGRMHLRLGIRARIRENVASAP